MAALTEKQYAMLVAANGCSLPGDGLRIKGAGQHSTADSLRRRGLVRVAIPADDALKARVHVTPEGRAERERIARELIRELIPGRAPGGDRE